MKRKAVILNDYVIDRKLCEPYLGFLTQFGYDVCYYQDYAGMAQSEARALMRKTEEEGPEAFSADQNLLEAVRDAEIVILHMSIINKSVIDAMPHCRILGVCRGGLTNINTDYAKQKGITIINAAEGSADAVADTTIFLMIGVLRGIIREIIGVRANGWQKKPHDMFNNHNLGRATVGLVGFGNIGQCVLHRLKAFGSKVLVHDPYMSADAIAALGGTPATLDEVMRQADLVSLHLRLSESTKHFIGAEQLGAMKPTAFLINTARAGLVDEGALLTALREHQIAGAALDVFNQEPLPPGTPLL